MSTASAKKKAVTEEILSWLDSNYQLSEGVCLPRSLLYSHYSEYCSSKSTEPIGAAAFGKMVRKRFSEITTRRLGTRGQSKYHYYGLGIKATSKYFMGNCGNGISFVPSPTDSSISSANGHHFQTSAIGDGKCCNNIPCDPSRGANLGNLTNVTQTMAHGMDLVNTSSGCGDPDGSNLLPSFAVFQNANGTLLNANQELTMSNVVNVNNDENAHHQMDNGGHHPSVKKRSRKESHEESSLVTRNSNTNGNGNHLNNNHNLSNNNNNHNHNNNHPSLDHPLSSVPVVGKKAKVSCQPQGHQQQHDQQQCPPPGSTIVGGGGGGGDDTVGHHRVTSLEQATAILNRSFPSYNLFIPPGVSHSNMYNFLARYRDHSVNLVKLLAYNNYEQFKLSMATFWSECSTDYWELFETEFVSSVIECCEILFYDAIELILINPSASTDDSIEYFIENYPDWLDVSINHLNPMVKKVKRSTSDDFIYLIRHELKLIPLIKSCNLIFSSNLNQKRMSELKKINFKSIEDELSKLSLTNSCMYHVKSLIYFLTNGIVNDDDGLPVSMSNFNTVNNNINNNHNSNGYNLNYSDTEFYHEMSTIQSTSATSNFNLMTNDSSSFTFAHLMSSTTAIVMDALTVDESLVNAVNTNGRSNYGNGSSNSYPCISIRQLNSRIWIAFDHFLHLNEISSVESVNCNGTCDHSHLNSYCDIITLMKERAKCLMFAISRSLHILNREMTLANLQSLSYWHLVFLFINDLCLLCMESIIRKEIHQQKRLKISRRCYQPEINPCSKEKELMMQLL